ncbi:N-acetylglucosamine kinase [Actinocatenispora rupis]|uniref:N-acetylglucosamine kinase n=1 Tax=Actinocatenispora rupis TaxID=519421 RepID=A0A8J3IZM8_9ACTN|nr:BadF/BadG/BcrA/BcrD ATPase family protein [Actinocatenispora rupis]GID13016.1 N-acetylglucosamine kinase [Actinocatenispora rupis]
MQAVLGLDMGGTATRAVLATTSGTILGSGRAGPGNPFAHPPEQAADALRSSVREALGDHDPATVRLGVVGLAGGNSLAVPAVAETFDRAWRDTGLRCPMRVVGDTDVAYAAGTADPDGAVLIAGTGASAARIAAHRTARAAGGYGWLLGDDGAGYWLGREAVRALLAVTDGVRPPGVLTELVAAHLAIDPAHPGTDTERVIAAVDHAHPVRLARLAPLVSEAATAGDAVAADIVTRAAGHLCALVAGAYAGGPVVLSGSVVAPGTPIGDAVRTDLPVLLGGVAVLSAGHGAAGAAWLAATALPDTPDPLVLHRSIVSRYDTAPSTPPPPTPPR